MYNPKLDDYLEEHPDVTVMGLYWAGWWRFALIVVGISFVLALIAEM